VTADAHQKRADKLMLRLDQLCADECLAKVIAAANAKYGLTASGAATIGDTIGAAADPVAQCGRLTNH
jgi:hypothetical protein